MKKHSLIYRLVALFVVLALGTPTVYGAPPSRLNSGAPTAQVEKGENSGLYRTTITVRNASDWTRLERLGIVVLDRQDDNAIVLVDDEQLETLAQLRFEPQASDEFSGLLHAQGPDRAWLAVNLQPLVDQGVRMQALLGDRSASVEAVKSERSALRAAMASLTPEQRAGMAASSSLDDDADGLTNTQEQWWCTNALNPDTDGDGATDGAEVQTAKDWMANRRAGPPGTGKPFTGWPSGIAGCPDDDGDDIPDLAERWELGLKMNNPSTDNDRYKDGMELFGFDHTGAMSPIVRPPGNHPLVAAYPVIQVDAIHSTFHVEAVTELHLDTTVITGTAKLYGTAETRGASDSVMDMVTWNEWQEVSISSPQVSGASQSNVLIGRQPDRQDGGFLPPWVGLTSASAGFLGSWWTMLTCATPATLTPAGAAACAGTFLIGQAVSTVLLAEAMAGMGDEINHEAPPMCIPPNGNRNSTISSCLPGSVDIQTLEQAHFAQQRVNTSSPDLALGGGGTNYTHNQQAQQIKIERYYPMSYPVYQPIPVITETRGHSWGGAHAVTHTEYQEHTISQSEQFSTEQGWTSGWANNTAHSADLTFSYRISNTGTDYARSLNNLIFNVYIGRDPYPAFTCQMNNPPPDRNCNLVSLSNVMPGDQHTYTTGRIWLSFEQMQALDLGGPIYVVVDSYSLGEDDVFFQNARQGGMTVVMDDGVDDGDESLDVYVLPVWEDDTVLDALARYFPTRTDAEGNLLAISTPEWTTPPTWIERPLTDASWFNLYLDNLGDGSTPFRDTPAQRDSTLLMRYQTDSDRDGYTDRSELRLGTDPHDSASHPSPGLVAGLNTTRAGDEVTGRLAFLNTGNYDAYGVEAIMYAPDHTVRIGNNTIGGGGRVKAASQVVLGSRVKAPGLGNWRNSTARPYSAGSYAGNDDKVFTFTAQSTGAVGGSQPITLGWTDGGATGTVTVPAGYQSPLPLSVTQGVEVGFYSGSIIATDSFTVAVQLPRDTFTYTVESEPFVAPGVVVSYNDPQGNHRFITPVELADLGSDLAPYADQMLAPLSLEIATTAAFTPTGSNTTHYVFNLPDSRPIEDGHLFVEYVKDDGTVVAEQVFTQTLQPGPNVIPVTWSTGIFTETYQTDHDYNILALVTDWQGNIIQSIARPLSSFQADPKPAFAMDSADVAWDFGTVTQGEMLEHTFTFANTGFLSLFTYLSSPSSMAVTGATSRQLAPGDSTTYTIALDTRTLPVGPYDQTITIRTSDPANSARTVHVTGNAQALSEAALSRSIVYRPWDRYVWVPGDHNRNENIDFSHRITTNPSEVEPLYVYDQSRDTLLGTGESLPAALSSGALPAAEFGDGSDGDLVVASGQTYYVDGVRTAVNGHVTAGQRVVPVASSTGFSAGDEILIVQMHGNEAGTYEFGTIAAVGTGTLTLEQNLAHEYNRLPGITLYELPNYQGRSETFYADDPCLSNNVIGNDTVSSIRASGYVVHLYLDCNYGEGGFWSVADLPDLGAYQGYDNAVSSIRVVPAQPYTAQVLRVPHYQTIQVQGGGTVTMQPWNGETGGFLALRASGSMTVQGGATVTANAKGYRGGNGGPQPTQNPSEPDGDSGESWMGRGISTGNYPYDMRVGSGEGGGARLANDWPPANNNGRAGGGGGGHGALGQFGQPINAAMQGWGGAPYGLPDLSRVYLGAGGGGGGGAQGYYGGKGGGAIFIAARELAITGSVTSNGQNGANGPHENAGAAGGGAGGSVLLRTQVGSIGNNLVTAIGGAGGASGGWNSGAGGGGAIGRIRVEYQTITPGWSTNPPASSQQVAFFAMEKLNDTTVRYILPESFTGGRTYWMQFGQRYQYPAAGDHIFHARLPKSRYTDARLDLILANAGAAPVSLCLDIGNDGACDWTYNGSPTLPFTTTTISLAAALTTYMLSAAPDPDGTVVVPIRVNLNTSGELFLTNLAATPAANVDLALSSSNITFGAPNPVEGDTVLVQAVIHNQGNAASRGVTASFYATAPTWGETYIGSDFVPGIAPGQAQAATINWNTLGFTGAVPVKVVVDPFDRLAETNEANNIATAPVTVLTRPDLSVEDPLALSDDEPVSGEAIDVTATIHNNGQTNAGNQLVSLYAGNPDAGGALIDTQIVASLAGGGQTPVTFPWTPAQPGVYRLFARADRDGNVNEYDEGNNDEWRDVYVGFAGPLLLDSGGTTGDPAYTAVSGYGVVDEGQPDIVETCGGGSAPEDTLRRDNEGRVVYRFDHLLPGHFYHLDVTLRQCDNIPRQESVYVDNGLVAGPITLNDTQARFLSTLLDPVLYANRTISVTIESDGGDGALVGEVNLYDIDYRYADAGGGQDPQYPGSQGYGWLEGVSNPTWGTLPYQSARINPAGSQLRYQFDGLQAGKRYAVNLTFFQSSGTGRQQRVEIDGQTTGLVVNTGDYTVHRERVFVPGPSYSSDGSIIVGIVRTDGGTTGAMINEISLEELTIRAPDITLTPASIAATQAQGLVGSQPLAIGNTGTANLNWTITEAPTDCASPGNVAWLGVSPSSGTTAAGGSTALTVSLDSRNLQPSTYNARLCVASNDPDQPLVVVPVQLTVTPATNVPRLTIPTNVPGNPYQTVTMPVQFTRNGTNIASMIFSVDYDQTCLQFDPTDSDGDGVPDAVTFSLSAAFQASVTFNAVDTDGELDFFIGDTFPPLSALPDGTPATIKFRVICQSPPGNLIVARVGFSTDPRASFGGTSGGSVPGVTSDGSVEIQPVPPGDCNADTGVDAGDISAVVLEIFDGDGDDPMAAPGGTFAGSPVGCDANQDVTIDAGDISCIVLLIFNGPNACSGSLNLDALGAPGASPNLSLLEPKVDGDRMIVPIGFSPGDHQISSVVFAIDYDPTVATIDPTDANGDGIPDAVALNLPPEFAAAVMLDQEAAQVRFMIADVSVPLAGLPEQVIATVAWQVKDDIIDAGRIRLSEALLASFGDVQGRRVLTGATR